MYNKCLKTFSAFCVLLRLFRKTSANFHEICSKLLIVDSRRSGEYTYESASALIENRWNNFSWGADKRRLHFSPSILPRETDGEIRRPSSRAINKIVLGYTALLREENARNLSFSVDDGTYGRLTSYIDRVEPKKPIARPSHLIKHIYFIYSRKCTLVTLRE